MKVRQVQMRLDYILTNFLGVLYNVVILGGGALIVIIAFLLLCSFIVTVIKRLSFFGKIGRICKKRGFDFVIRNRIRSIFKREEADIEIDTGAKKYRIFVLTTVFKRTRYHFEDGKVRLFRKGIIFNFANRTMGRNIGNLSSKMSVGLIENKFITFKNYEFPTPEKNEELILCVFPIPLMLTVTDGNKLSQLYNGDKLTPDVTIRSGKGLREFLGTI